MARKTDYVEVIKEQVNNFLKESICSPDRRQGQIDILDSVLHRTGNYNGFRHLQKMEVPYSAKPGIFVDGTVENTPYEKRFGEHTDQTRVHYF